MFLYCWNRGGRIGNTCTDNWTFSCIKIQSKSNVIFMVKLCLMVQMT